MKDRYLFRGKRYASRDWVVGYYAGDNRHIDDHCIYDISDYSMTGVEIDPSTLGQCTGKRAAKSYRGESDEDRLIFIGDLTKLKLPDGTERIFEVRYVSVVRDVVNHPAFVDGTSRVEINGVAFCWDGYELFPCVDGHGIADYEKMEIIGTIHDKKEDTP